MRKKLLSFSLLITSSLITVLAQVPLDTFIGQTSLPNDDDAVCYIPIYPEITTELPEPLQALASGTDGLDDIRQITAQAPHRLTANGWLLLEHGYDQAAAVRELLAQAGFHQVQSRRDLAGIERCSGGQISRQHP